MKRKFTRAMSAVLALVLALSLVQAPAPAAEAASSPANALAHWFYDQLSNRAKAIYDAMADMYDRGLMASGRGSYDLYRNGVVTQAEILDYVSGKSDLFNDFAAAKDAFDLEHPEVWYVDSSYLSLRITNDSDGVYHAWMGPGRTDNYYVQGVTGSADVTAKTKQLDAAVDAIVKGARALSTAGLTAAEAAAQRVRYVHDQITGSISYRYETDCTAGNEGYIRTTYALVTHEGVCEAYARSMQLILSRLGIPCVPIHGLQTSGNDPELHMWNAVQIGGEWYVVDATWDDPVPLKADGTPRTGKNGVDGGEHRTYLLVGQDVVGANWVPAGNVSTGPMVFEYPTITARSYKADELFSDADGFMVTYTEGQMETVEAGHFEVSFKGMNATQAAKAGFYMLMNMYYYDRDGALKSFDNWYYVDATLKGVGDHNPYFKETENKLVFDTIQAAYVAFAITTRVPGSYDRDPMQYPVGYYEGDGSDIFCETGMLYNANGNDGVNGYRAQPYVKNLYPNATTETSVKELYHVHVEFDDTLFHPTQADIDGYTNTNAAEKAAVLKDMTAARDAAIGVSYLTYDLPKTAGSGYTLHNRNGSTAGKVTFRNLTWLFECDQTHVHSVGTCPVRGMEFDFQASEQWADDNILYQFTVNGLVGAYSKKAPNTFGWVMVTPSCPTAYRCRYGIDWNLWGQPSLMDNIGDLDLSKVVTEGANGYQQSLQALQEQMNIDDINGRLMLVVEDLSTSRPRSQEVMDALEEHQGISDGDIAYKSMYEIGFTRICKQVVLKTGQSLRLSIGFPPGFSYEESMNGVVFKAYHFTRDDDGNIISVEELPIAVTPYGLVILCDSFSPFEIVALDRSAVPDWDPNTRASTLVIGTDGNGKVSYMENGKKVYAVGEKGMISLSDGQRRVFTIEPADGYVVASVTFDGRPMTVSADNTVTISSRDLASAATAGLLQVEFLSASVRSADEERGMDHVEPEHPVETVPNPAAPDTSSAVALPFTDVPTNAWYYESVRYMYEHKLVDGTSETTFSPGDYSTRAQLVTILWRMSGSPVTQRASTFQDVPTGRWYTDAVNWAAVNGIVDGYDELTFGPGDNVTREQVVTILYRYAKYRGHSVSGSSNALAAYTDSNRIAMWAFEAMNWAVRSGIIEGVDETTLNPKGLATRAQLAAFLQRFDQKILGN